MFVKSFSFDLFGSGLRKKLDLDLVSTNKFRSRFKKSRCESGSRLGTHFRSESRSRLRKIRSEFI